MSKVEGEMQDLQWYERIERETVGYAYRPLSKQGCIGRHIAAPGRLLNAAPLSKSSS